jgi:hypothetical protein
MIWLGKVSREVLWIASDQSCHITATVGYTLIQLRLDLNCLLLNTTVKTEVVARLYWSRATYSMLKRAMMPILSLEESNPQHAVT